MSENNDDTNFDKGARIINAVVAETDLPADLKVNVQGLVTTLLTQILPGLFAPPTTAPAPDPEGVNVPPGFLEAVERLLAQGDDDDPIEVQQARTSVEDVRRQVSLVSADREASSMADLGYRIISMTLDAFLGARRHQSEEVSNALLVAFQHGADPVQISEALLAACPIFSHAHQQVVERILALPPAFGAMNRDLH